MRRVSCWWVSVVVVDADGEGRRTVGAWGRTFLYGSLMSIALLDCAGFVCRTAVEFIGREEYCKAAG